MDVRSCEVNCNPLSKDIMLSVVPKGANPVKDLRTTGGGLSFHQPTECGYLLVAAPGELLKE
jgi:hypothetical protein